MGKISFSELKTLLPELRENVLLKDYTTFKIGGPAKFFYVAETSKDLIKAVRMAKEHGLPFFILGGGSKLLVSDNGYDGMVIQVKSSKYKVLNYEAITGSESDRFQNYSSKLKVIFAEAGTRLAELVKLSLKESLTGLEWGVGIPGTISGAIYGNAGAFDKHISDAIKEVEVLDTKTFKFQTFNSQECLFGRKQSVFKQNKNLVILSAKIQLNQENKKDVEAKVEEYLTYRNQTQPLEFASAGCIFINPENSPAGLLIDKCGLKGKTIGGAQISERHANFIINLGNAKAKDVIKLIELAKTKVKEKFGIELEEEIQHPAA